MGEVSACRPMGHRLWFAAGLGAGIFGWLALIAG
jgi:hypothetical protein